MVSRELQVFLIRAAGRDMLVPMQIDLRYDADTDPLAIEAVISSERMVGVDEHNREDDDLGRPVTWVFSRDLLVEAVATTKPTGVGDVRLRAGRNNCLFLCLNNPAARADFKLPLDEVKEFLDDTADDAQNLNSLHLDLDEFLTEVLGS